MIQNFGGMPVKIQLVDEVLAIMYVKAKNYDVNI
jgi:hypothetical protein